MKLQDVILKNIEEATKEEVNYINNSKIEKRFICKKAGNIIYVFDIWKNQSDSVFVRVAFDNGKGVISSMEELNHLKDCGYEITEIDN